MQKRSPIMAAMTVFALAVAPAARLARGAGQDDATEPGGAAFVALARSAVVSEVTGKPPASPPQDTAAPARGVFVTVERKGQVVGCRGELAPRERTLGEEIVHAARAAAGHDPRYRPLTPTDLAEFKVTVTLIDHLEPIAPGEIGTLSPEEGLVLTQGTRSGVVLPWEGKDPAVRLLWAYRKAGIAEGASCTLRRMFARRYRG